MTVHDPAGGADEETGPGVSSPDDRPFWHLAELVHWQAATRSGRYRHSTLGATVQEVGFLHAAYPEQLPAVVRAHYARYADPLVVLEIDPAAVRRAGVEVRLEPGDPGDPGSPLFPHVYGPLPVSAVLRTRPAVVDRGWLDLGPWEPAAAAG